LALFDLKNGITDAVVTIKNIAKIILPFYFLEFYSYAKNAKNEKNAKVIYDKNIKSYCPICMKTTYFLPYGHPSRNKAQCPYCGSLERHRLLWLFFKVRTNLFEDTFKRILHVAPEVCFENRLKKRYAKNYITADLHNPSAMVKMDVTNIPYPDENFDIIICNHVLEHVPDDKKAMSEFYRILKKNGWAVLLVPLTDMGTTYEDFSIVTDDGRAKAFGQWDHVRKYGRDYIERLKSAGFDVISAKLDELVTTEEIERMCLKERTESCDITNTEIFYCVKS